MTQFRQVISLPASPIFYLFRLQRGEEGQGCSWRERAAGSGQGARDFLERRQRRVALERLRERRGARLADLAIEQAVARTGGSGMLIQGRQHRAGRAYDSDVSDAFLLSASESAAAPASPIRVFSRLQRGQEGQGCSWRYTKAQS
jgi:hypothetical protein